MACYMHIVDVALCFCYNLVEKEALRGQPDNNTEKLRENLL